MPGQSAAGLPAARVSRFSDLRACREVFDALVERRSCFCVERREAWHGTGEPPGSGGEGHRRW